MSDPDEMIPVLFPRSLVEAMRDEVDIDYGTVRAACIAAAPTVTVDLPFEVVEWYAKHKVDGIATEVRRACLAVLKSKQVKR